MALGAVAARIRGYAAHDIELNALVAQLERDAARLAAPMPEMARKQMHSESCNIAHTRSVTGQARRAQ